MFVLLLSLEFCSFLDDPFEALTESQWQTIDRLGTEATEPDNGDSGNSVTEHEGELGNSRSYGCDECGKCYKHKQSLYRHKKCHSEYARNKKRVIGRFTFRRNHELCLAS